LYAEINQLVLGCELNVCPLATNTKTTVKAKPVWWAFTACNSKLTFKKGDFFCSLTTQYLSIYFHLLPVPLSLLQFCVNYLKPEKWHAV